jgi:16S rRNA (adenine1518-N6/adenine1519-N6)-dimethyltransferase
MKKKLTARTRQPLGQHFLVDIGVRDRIIDSLGLQSADHVVEIGAGRGYLTEALAPCVKRLWAIEIDPRYALRLKTQFINSSVVEVLEGDFLRIDLRSLAAQMDKVGKLRVVGNLPYFISSPILFRLLEYSDLISDVTLMLQQEMAERITATPTSRDYGYASLVTQLFSRPTMLFSVPPKAFSPPPQVHSSVIRLVMASRTAALSLDDMPQFLKFAQQIFLEKRKTLLNNLRRFIPAEASGPDAPLPEIFRQCKLDSKVRAENLSLEATAQLYRALRQRGWLC